MSEQEEKYIVVDSGNDANKHKRPFDPTGNPYGRGGGHSNGSGRSGGFGPDSGSIGGFSGGFGGNSRKRARKRAKAIAQHRANLQAQAQQQAAAHAQAQAQAEQQARAQAHAQAQAAEQARAQAAAAQAQREQAYRQTISDFIQTQQTVRSDLAQRYDQTAPELPTALLGEIQSDLEPLAANPTRQQLAELILQEKSRINYLLARKQAELEQRNLKMLAQGEALSVTTPEQYRHYLESRSQGDPQRAQQAHQVWTDAVSNVHEARLLAESVAFLEQRSTELSERHARMSQARQDNASSPRAGAERLWSAIAASNTPGSLPTPAEGLEKAGQIAKEIFIRTAISRLKLNPGVALALYSPTLGNAELTPTVVASPASQLNLPSQVDMEYVASVNGSIDVPHRLVMEDDGQQSVAKWVVADGVNVGTKVRVRNFTYNAQNNTYEFIRDGDTQPALVWTPIEQPADSSTRFPGQKPVLPVDPGVDVSPQGTRVDELPSFVNDNPDDYILVFPPGSGLPDTYLLFKDPRTIPGVATGYGKPVAGIWLGENTRAQGAPIPSQIADQLRGREFSSFDKFREALWETVARSPELKKQFNGRNTLELELKNAPFTKVEDQIGGRKKFEVHHVDEVARGGAVYDIDNMTILTPKQHIQLHKEKRHDH
ncbi:S-type pyocin domain-containing protein [Pseudomonas cichorii]|uniref:S-type pyocin domain-containing protein n=1 Tax=Pseudomonas cichorii TaxID=36746 RepID=UPI001C892A2D|nr:S-type pyocin domain-containing protein [Pseudomonas cichorii]MBX8493559.1 S-type pyocin domain-containing protein [Pseudomonas cichorii]